MAKGAGSTVTPSMRGGGGKGKGGGGKGGGTVGFTGMSPAQFAKYVNASVGSMYNPELTAMKNYQSGVDQQFGHEIGETNLGATELAQMFAQIAPTIKGYYDQAANTDAAFGKGFGSAINDVAPGVDPGVGSVLATMYGMLPGETLAQQGAAEESAASQLPTTATALATSADNAIAGQQSKSDLGYESHLATLLGEMGKAKLQVGQDLQNQAYKQFEGKLALSRLGLAQQKTKFDEWARTQSLGLQNKRYGLSVAEFNQRQAHEAQMLGLSVAKFNYEQRHAAAVQSRLSQQDKTRLYESATKAGQLMYTGKRGEEKILPNGTKTYVGGTPQFSYQQTVNSLMKQFPGLGPQGAMQIANSLYKPGERGRPANAGINNEYWTTGADGQNYNYSVPGGLSPQARHQVDGILSLAHEYLGTPYVWGGTSPKGFDCSGFAQYVYSKVGLNIPRTTYDQWTDPHGAFVSKGLLEPGDLVYYKGSDSIVRGGRLLPGHVGIYIGHGLVIDAYGTGYGVRIDPVNSPALGGYMGAKRWEQVKRYDTPSHPNRK